MKTQDQLQTMTIKWALPLTLLAGAFAITALFIWAGVWVVAVAVACIAATVLAVNLLLRIAANRLNKKRQTPKWLKHVASASLVFGTLLLGLSALVYVIQDNMLFYNVHGEESRAYLAGNPNYSEIEFIAANGNTYHGMLYRFDADADAQSEIQKGSAVPSTVVGASDSDEALHTSRDTAPLIIYFGGNGEVSYDFMQNCELRGLWSNYANYNLLFVDYEGYGLNDGQASGQSIYEQALAVYDYATTIPGIDSSHIVAMGYSLGTGPAVYLASQRSVNGLILMAPYARGLDIYNAMLPIFVGPTELLVKHKLPSEVYAPSVTCDILIVASHTDEAVPYESSQRLATLFAGSLKFVELEKVSHNGVIESLEAKNSIRAFLQELADD